MPDDSFHLRGGTVYVMSKHSQEKKNRFQDLKHFLRTFPYHNLSDRILKAPNVA